MKWFKFYGQDYLSDPKMLSLSASERSCWITLLSYSSINDNGVITFLSEQQLMLQAGLDFTCDEWDRTVGILKKLEDLQMISNDNGMITVTNWQKRQETNLTSYERVKRFREKKRNDNAMITLEENRIDKKREDKIINTPISSSISYLSNIPEEDILYFLERFDVGRNKIKSKAEDLVLYCQSNGRKYKNYRSFLLNAMKKDFPVKKPKEVEQPREAGYKIPEDLKSQIKSIIK